MKKFILPFLLVFILSFSANGQKKNLVKTSLIFPLGEIFDLSYERVLNEEMSLVLEGIVGGDFAGVSPQFRYYLSEKNIAPSGGFIAPFIRYQNYSFKSQDLETTDDAYAKGSLSAIGGGLLIGYQRLFKETISLSAFIGPSYNSSSISYESNEDVFDFDLFNGFGVRAGVNVGFAF